MNELKIVKECEWARWYECDGKTAVVVSDNEGVVVKTYGRSMRFEVHYGFGAAERLLRKWWDLPEPVTNEHKGRMVYISDDLDTLKSTRVSRELYLVDYSLRYPYLIKTESGNITSYRYCKLVEVTDDN
jgi:hypothetical protein